MSEWRILIRDLNYTTPGFMPLALRTPAPFHTISMKRTTSFQRSSSPRPGTLSRLTQDILKAQASVDGTLRHEKLSVRKECALLLPWVTKHTQTKDLEIDWDEYLPAFNSNRNLELETPLLEETAGEALVNHTQPLPGLGQKLDPVHDHVRGSGDADLPDGLRDSVDVAMAKIKNEKLHCSKESLRLIQKTTSSTSLFPQDLHELWDTVRVEEESTKPTYTPVVISAELQRPFSPVFDKANVSISKSPRTETRVQSSQPSPNGSPSPSLHDVQECHLNENIKMAHCEESPSAKRAVRDSPSLSRPSTDEHDQDGHRSKVIGSHKPSQAMNDSVVSLSDCHSSTSCPQLNKVSTLLDNSAQPDVAYSFPPVHSPTVTLYPISTPQSEASLSQIPSTIHTGTEPIRTVQSKRRRSNQGNRAKRPKIHRERALSPQTPTSPFTTLGSLSTFMETRIRAKRHIAKSAYFSNKSSDVSQTQEDTVAESTPVAQEPSNDPHNTTSQLTARVPQYDNVHHTLTIFLSTALLKTHLGLVQSLERADERPVIIYRDYSNNQPNQPVPQKEADIIISPTTSIILTTSQATTQRYLPGHKPHSHITSHHHNKSSSSIKATINSPLREQIFLLAPRYENIYVLITHTTPPPPNSDPQHKHQPWTADEQILSNVASLAAFCASLAPQITVQPLVIPSGAETVARWVLALATKHAIALSGGSQSLGSVEETCWEVFLRRMGLNSYAARALLDSLKGSSGTGGGGELSWLLEMSEQNRRVWSELIGERVFRRLEGILEKDWQCDWALSFGDSQD